MPLSTDFINNPQAFCTRWVIKAPGGHSEGAGLQGNAPSFLPDRTGPAGGPKRHVGYDLAAAPVRVQWYQYDRDRVQPVVENSSLHGGLQFTHVPLTNDWFDCFVLPWGIGKAARMVLPDQTGVANPVRAFITAEMNGCAFLAAGNPLAPVVAHLNVNVAVAALTPAQKDQELERMTTSVLKLTRGGPAIGNTTATVLRWKPPAPVAPGTLGARLARLGGAYGDTGAEIATYDANTAAQLAARRHKFEIAPTTDIRLATMGVMDLATRRWKFFYQRNICTQYQHKQRLGLGAFGGLAKKVLGDPRVIHAVTRYDHMAGAEYVEIWPNGTGILPVPAHGDPTQA